MARVLFPVVVDGVQERVAADFGRAPGGVVDVVSFEGDGVLRAREVERPVVLVVAGGGPAGRAVDFVVGNCHAAGGGFAEDDVLAADEGGLGMEG